MLCGHLSSSRLDGYGCPTAIHPNSPLTRTEVSDLTDQILQKLGASRLPRGDSEYDWTHNYTYPIALKVCKRAKGNLKVTAHGNDPRVPQVPPVRAFGDRYFPDVAVHSARGESLVGFEVKCLKARGRQGAISAALGQGVIYRTVYGEVVLVLVDEHRDLSVEQLTALTRMARKLRLRLLYRSRARPKALITGRSLIRVEPGPSSGSAW
jgi:hypothetical protein